MTLSATAPLWIGIFIGAVIGGLAELWGISNSDVLLKLSKWEDRLFINCIAIAIGAGAVRPIMNAQAVCNATRENVERAESREPRCSRRASTLRPLLLLRQTFA